MKKNKKRGISLIVLIISIIVLIIISAAVILTITHSGLILKAKNATNSYNKAKIKERELLSSLSGNDIETKIASDIGAAVVQKGTDNGDFAGNSTVGLFVANKKDADYYNVHEETISDTSNIISGIYRNTDEEYYDFKYSTNTSLEIKKKELLNVNDIGIYGDGTTDCSSKIANAIGKYKGKYILYFPSGTYIIDSVYVRANDTFLLGDDNTTFYITKTFLFDSVSNLTLSNIDFVRNSDYVHSDIADNSILLHFHTKYSDSKNIDIVDCTFTDSNYGIKFNTYTSSGYNMYNVVLKNVNIQNCVNSLYMNCVKDSLATDITINQTKDYPNASQLQHSLYLSYDCDNLTYRNLTIDGGYDTSVTSNPATLQAYAEYGGTMGKIMIDGIDFKNRTGNYSRLLSTGTCEKILLKNVMLDAPTTEYSNLISNYNSNLIIQDSTFNCRKLKFTNHAGATTTINNCNVSLYDKQSDSTTFDNRGGNIVFKNSVFNIIDPLPPFRLFQLFYDNSHTEFTNNTLNIISTNDTLYANSGSCYILFINWKTSKIGTLKISNNTINANHNLYSAALVATDATNYKIDFTNNKLLSFDSVFGYKSSVGNENFDVTGTTLTK